MMGRIEKILSALNPGDKIVVEMVKNNFKGDNILKVGTVIGQTARQIRVEVEGQKMNFTKDWGHLVGGDKYVSNVTKIKVGMKPEKILSERNE